MNDMNTLVSRMREASVVERAHTIRHIGSYTNGQHSFDMMTLAWILMPVVTRNVMLAIMFHDLPERWTGDMPSTAKESDGEFGKRMAQIEARIESRMGWKVELHPDERVWVKALDKLELLLWSHDQLHMGNENALAIISRLAGWFQVNPVPHPVVDFLEQYSWMRTSDDIPK